MEKSFDVLIKTSPQRLWRAITDTTMQRRFSFGGLTPSDWTESVAVVVSDWTPGSHYQGIGDGTPIFEGENIEVDPPRRLIQNFRALWNEEVKAEGTTRVTWNIEPTDGHCVLRVTHGHLRDEANPQLYAPWPLVLEGIKTLVEGGQVESRPGWVRWSENGKTD